MRNTTNYQQAVGFIDRHIGLGWKPGLERMARLMDMMGSPHTGYPIVHVTGTNGKTTVTHITAALISYLGLKAGTYISPHLERVEQRYGVGAEPASPQDFAQAIADVAPFADLLESETGERPTYFELTTAGAFAFFSGLAVDAAVVEVGLGGRLDATNVVDAQVAVLTGVALEHTAFLGNTLEEIAQEKLAILKPGASLVTGCLPSELARLAQEFADRQDARWFMLGRDFQVENLRMAVGGWVMDVEGIYERYEDVFVPLHGRHQVDNAALSIAAVENLLERALPEVEVQQALASVQVPARLEVVGRQPLVVLDGAHNPASCARLAECLREEMPDLPWTLVVGAMEDKDLDAMLAPLAGLATKAVATAADSPRSRTLSEVVDALERVFPGIPVAAQERVSDAVRQGREWTGAEEAMVVFGSLYVAGEARPHLLEAEV